MSVNMEITYLTDDTVRIQYISYDFDGSLMTPTSDELVIYDPSGTNMGTHTTTNDGTGTYRADYYIPSDGTAGQWKVSCKVLSGTWPAREIGYFQVCEG